MGLRSGRFDRLSEDGSGDTDKERKAFDLSKTSIDLGELKGSMTDSERERFEGEADAEDASEPASEEGGASKSGDA